jgi:lipopolysaccharide export system permease protein
VFRIVDRHVFLQLLGPFLFGLLGALIIIAFGPMNRAIKFLLAGKVPAGIVLKWFVFRVPEDMQFIFPVATLMATLLGFARLSKDGELTALRAAGISLIRLLVPVMAFGVLATGATYFFLNRLVPPSMVTSQDLWVHHFRSTLPPTFKENFTLKTSGDRLVSVGRVNLRDPVLHRVTVRDYPDGPGEGLRQISGPRARWEPASRRWVLEDARVDRYAVDEVSGEVQGVETRLFPLLPLDLKDGPEVFQAPERSAQEQTPEQLSRRIEEIEEKGLGSTLDLRVELYLKSSFPFCVLLFALLGATMGITNARAGGFMGFGVALLLTFLYYVTMSLSASLGKSGTLSPLLSAWLHNLVFAVVVVYKARQASQG